MTLVKPADRMNVFSGRLCPVVVMIGPTVKMNQQLPVIPYFSWNVEYNDYQINNKLDSHVNRFAAQ